MKGVQESSFYQKSKERRNQSRERIVLFANYLDSLPESTQDDIKETAWRIADEVTEENSTDEGWYGGAAFKRRLDRLLKRYLSGFNRDIESLLSEASLNAQDAEIARVALAAAEQELTRFAELQFSEPNATEDTEDTEGEKVAEVKGEVEETDEDAASFGRAAVDGETIRESTVGVGKEYRAPSRTYEPRRSPVSPSESFGEQLDRERTEKLERLNRELRAIQEEMQEWEVSSPLQYEQAVDVLVREHDLSPEDAMRLVNGINTMNRWLTTRTIRDVRRTYFLEKNVIPTHGKGHGLSR